MIIRAIWLAVTLAIPQTNCPTKLKPNYKVTKLSVQDVGVSCNNGQVPEVQKLGKTLVISCDAE